MKKKTKQNLRGLVEIVVFLGAIIAGSTLLAKGCLYLDKGYQQWLSERRGEQYQEIIEAWRHPWYYSRK